MSKRSIACSGILGLLLLAGCAAESPPAVETETSAAPAARETTVRMSTAGVGTGFYNRIVYWLGESLVRDGAEVTVWPEYRGSLTGRGFRDGVLRLADRRTDLAVVNSHGLAKMAFRGNGLFDRPLPIRAIAVLPEHDWAVFGVDASLGIRSFADLREQGVGLRVATGYTDGDNLVGFLVTEVLRRHGIDASAPDSGWEFISGGEGVRRNYESGETNAWFNEAAFPQVWNPILAERPTAYLSIEPEVAREFEEELGVISQTVPAGTYPGQDEPILALDFSGFILGVHEDMDDDLAYLLARTVVEHREEIDETMEFGGLGIRAGMIMVSRPFAIDPRTAADTPIPLHPGAERYYREQGYLE